VNFDFSDEQYMLRDGLRRYLSDNWGAKKARALTNDAEEALWNDLCGLGVTTLLVPEDHGGSGVAVSEVSMVLEEFGRFLVPAPMADTIIASLVLNRHGTEAQRGSLLPAIADGSCRIAFAHVESGAGYRLDDVHAQAIKEGKSFVLKGRKILVAGAERATHFLVSARDASDNVRLFICARGENANINSNPNKTFDIASTSSALTFDSVPAELVGGDEANDALALMLDGQAFSASSQMAGISSAAMDLAVQYSKERTQFDRLIGSFQAIKHKCADMLVSLETSRTAAYYAGWGMEGSARDRGLAVSMAKSFGGDACRQICNESLQIHGGVGFTWEFDVHLYLKRGKFLEYAYGDAAFHRERIASIVIDEHAVA
jgi:alkylation response protein AidB-like acyl-CoA dehydrogenase